ncbi:hypothetical protein GO986_11155 [Deinococcus sp. HMF7620]|uniref:Uncharacterized protein n=1 Tax=Deinococcus arboris TaxID=2682977 RepID=A0A7C9HRX3_9DEIO|nr:hypothetical protein [Deinococcus arboris]MVN87329.1 hypothetical protein [Deinococcus arboris]
MRLNGRHALAAVQTQEAHPDLLNDKRGWWAAVQAERGITRANHNGVLDVVRALIVLGALQSHP